MCGQLSLACPCFRKQQIINLPWLIMVMWRNPPAPTPRLVYEQNVFRLFRSSANRKHHLSFSFSFQMIQRKRKQKFSPFTRQLWFATRACVYYKLWRLAAVSMPTACKLRVWERSAVSCTICWTQAQAVSILTKVSRVRPPAKETATIRSEIVLNLRSMA